MSSSAPMVRIAASIDVTAAMTTKISKRAPPAVRVARKTAMTAEATLPS